MNIESIMLSKITQSQKVKYSMVYLYKLPKAVEFTETESRIMVARSGGQGEHKSYCLMGAECQDRKRKKFWSWTVATGAQQCECTYTTEACVLKWLNDKAHVIYFLLPKKKKKRSDYFNPQI